MNSRKKKERKINRKLREKVFNQLKKGPNSSTRIDDSGNEIHFHQYGIQWKIDDSNKVVLL